VTPGVPGSTQTAVAQPRFLWCALALLLFALGSTSAVAAQASVPDRAATLAGSYTVEADAQARLRAAVEEAVAGMNFVLRPVARRRLLAVNQPSTRVDIAVRGDSIILHYSNQPELRAQRRGASRPWKNAAGENIAVEVRAPASAAESEPLLRERYTAEDGTRENRWFFDAATGKARLEVTITSPRLPAPMHLHLTYNRVTPR
jgi:hypothetical protein